MENQKEIVNVDKIELYNFLNTASEKDLQEILEFIAYLKRNISIEDRNLSGN